MFQMKVEWFEISEILNFEWITEPEQQSLA